MNDLDLDERLDRSTFEILERVLAERGVKLMDLDNDQRQMFLLLVARGLCEKAARERVLGAIPEVQERSN